MTNRLTTTLAATAMFFGATAATADSIVEIAVADDRFSTLVAALTAAELVETLQGEGPFTVFAPVNDAFAALPDGTVETLLMPENKEQLTNVLVYHVAGGSLAAGDIPEGSTAVEPLLSGATLCVTKADGSVMIADGTGESATVIIADIMADNGVIHVVDKVLLPGEAPECN